MENDGIEIHFSEDMCFNVDKKGGRVNDTPGEKD